MGIPLPALATQPPPDPTQGIERLLALKSMLGQQQLQQGKLQEQQSDLALKQQAVKDQQTVMSYMLQNPKSTFGDAAEALKGQVSLPAYTNLVDTDAQIRQKHATATQAELDNHQKVHDQQQRIYNNAANLSDEDLAKQWPSIAQEFNSIPGNTAKVDPAQPLTKAQLQQHGIALGLQEAYLKQEADKRKETAETEEKSTAAAKNTAEIQGLTGQFAEAKYRNVLSQMSAGKPVSDDDLTFAKGYEAANKKTTTQSDSLGVSSVNTTGPSGLSAVGNRQGGKFITPGGGGAQAPAPASASPQTTKDSLIDLIGHYKADPTILSRLMAKHPDVLAQVHLKYPDWDQTDYGAKNKIVQSYTSGPESKSINAISTALGHSGELGQAIDALGNSNGLNMLRSLANKINVQVLGDDKVGIFNTIVHRLAPEITAAYVQGGGGEGERIAAGDDFSAALGDKQLRGNLGITVKLLRSKIAAQEQQWNNTYKPSRPEDDFATRFLTPGAKEALQKYSPQAGTTGGYKPPANAPSATGPNGHKIVVDGGKWVDAVTGKPI